MGLGSASPRGSLMFRVLFLLRVLMGWNGMCTGLVRATAFFLRFLFFLHEMSREFRLEKNDYYSAALLPLDYKKGVSSLDGGHRASTKQAVKQFFSSFKFVSL